LKPKIKSILKQILLGAMIDLSLSSQHKEDTKIIDR